MRLFFNPATCEWLDVLCQRARNEQTPDNASPPTNVGARKLVSGPRFVGAVSGPGPVTR